MQLGERFWSKVDIGANDECWPWLAGVNAKGYGRYSLEGGPQLAHRLVLGLRVGDPGWALHRCDNPPCCNPRHLYRGTPMDNTHDAIRRGRFPSLSGSASARSIDSPAFILHIREMAERGVPVRDIARRVDRNSSWVWRVVNGQRWPKGPWPKHEAAA